MQNLNAKDVTYINIKGIADVNPIQERIGTFILQQYNIVFNKYNIPNTLGKYFININKILCIVFDTF